MYCRQSRIETRTSHIEHHNLRADLVFSNLAEHLKKNKKKKKKNPLLNFVHNSLKWASDKKSPEARINKLLFEDPAHLRENEAFDLAHVLQYLLPIFFAADLTFYPDLLQ